MSERPVNSAADKHTRPYAPLFRLAPIALIGQRKPISDQAVYRVGTKYFYLFPAGCLIPSHTIACNVLVRLHACYNVMG